MTACTGAGWRTGVVAREKITVLNLRHALSTALVAAVRLELGRWDPGT